MSTRPRNPRYFPRMKVRGARRRRIAPMQRVFRSFDQFGYSMAAAANALVKLGNAGVWSHDLISQHADASTNPKES